jgi:hypothetical protein
LFRSTLETSLFTGPQALQTGVMIKQSEITVVLNIRSFAEISQLENETVE